ncbi:putative leucine-rich repeat receptor-like serine/threonine-protein kinase At2g24130 [Aristolochia californica]|uniref:putative leucine-rich repeat receptor-like serine/threonine-protein kinase At2g24130 n=1 Tax=Aristolochia californica TaxID=171875 RepID=UPI0035DD6CB4
MDHLSMTMIQLLLCTVLFFIHVLPLHAHQQPLGLLSDQTALTAFKKGISSDPRKSLENWKENTHVCNWNGVFCDSNGTRVIHLILAGSNLHGILSPYLSNLTYLKKLDLSENSFCGPIPSEFGELASLDEFSLRGNEMQNEVPESLGRLTRLRYIDLSNNQLQGRLPTSLFCNCTRLQYIDLSNNSFTGVIPSQIGNNLPLLQTLNLYMNQLSGYFPPSLSNASSMIDLDLELNYLTGPLPSWPVRYMFQLETLHLSDNSFSSDYSNTNLAPFFTSIANLTHLRELELAANTLGGELPLVIGRLHTNLSELHLEDNLIHGAIPPNIANLSNLTLLNLSSNRLDGTIPPELSLLPKLERLCLSNNSLTGVIPAALGALSHLGLLDLSMNELTGPIPSSIANLTQLRKLVLNDNMLSGTIPSSLGRSVNLEILDLSNNRLTGSIPAEVAGLGDITIYFNVSNNVLGGTLSEEFSKMEKVQAIDLSSNNLSGRIPTNLGRCLAVQLINLSHNALAGPIPGSLANLLSIQWLDLSHNQLSGEIPAAFQNCNTLAELDLSFNNLSGSIPKGGPFSSFTVNSFEGNQGLCGFPAELSSCHAKKQHDGYSTKFLAILVSIVSVSVFLLTICCVVSIGRIRKYGFGKNAGARSKTTPVLGTHPRITYRELADATGGFHESRLIGSGSFGRVYKGVFNGENVVAVKVLQVQGGNSTKSFNRECQILKQIRHRNLMRIVTACSLPDFKALVLPFMANGSLESHLYGDSTRYSSLSLIERVNICSDVAEGMAYLHHHSPVQVIHCDLKPSNILLNDDMTALVSDFGIARLVMTVDQEGNMNSESSTNSTTNLLCGSVGYIAPEYGLGRAASTKGDVYSFGVLVLEMVTGKRPTDEFFNGCLSLIRWVKTHYHGRLEKVIDSSLLRASWDQSSEVRSMWEVALVELIELGLLCTQEAPSTRPIMVDAADDLARLKRYLSGDTTATFASSLGTSSSTVIGGYEN